MRRTGTILTLVAGLLGGCGKMMAVDTDAPGQARGRYAGIGVVDPGRLWEQLQTPDPRDPKAPKDAALAALADDEHVIIVVDSHTGEVRQCGDRSGFCVAMNPWAGPAPAATPARLVKHAADLDREAEEARKRDEQANGAAARKKK